MVYKVNIEETVNGEFEVEANSNQEAFDIARRKYFDGEFVNEPGKLTCVQMAVAERNEDYSHWEGL